MDLSPYEEVNGGDGVVFNENGPGAIEVSFAKKLTPAFVVGDTGA